VSREPELKGVPALGQVEVRDQVVGSASSVQQGRERASASASSEQQLQTFGFAYCFITS
jgi:hypothetical protein